MPTIAQRQKTQKIREYYQQNYAGTTQVPEASIRDDIMKRFSLNMNRWYALKPTLKKLKPSEANGQGTLIETPITSPSAKSEEIVIPADLSPDAKVVINKLLGRNGAQADDMRVMQAEIAMLRAQLAITSKKLDACKGLACDAIKAM